MLNLQVEDRTENAGIDQEFEKEKLISLINFLYIFCAF